MRVCETPRIPVSQSYLSTDLISSELSDSECAMNQPSLPWLRLVRTRYFTLSCLIGRSHGKLGRFTVHLLSLSPNEMKSDEMRLDEWYERSGSFIIDKETIRFTFHSTGLLSQLTAVWSSKTVDCPTFIIIIIVAEMFPLVLTVCRLAPVDFS